MRADTLRRTHVAAAFLIAVQLLAAPSPAQAQVLSSTVPAQPLARALEMFAQESGLQLVYRSELTAGISTRGARAGLRYEEALRELLRDTGLGFEFVNAQTVALRTAVPGDQNKNGTVPAGGASATLPTEAIGPANATTTSVGSDPAARPPSSPELTIEEFTVAASRIDRDGFTAPTPTVVLSTAELTAGAPANIADAVNYLPVLSGSNTNRSSNAGGGAAAGMNLLNLRALGPNRTLVLLDGHRLVPSTVTGNVDANLFPQTLVRRVEIVTGGASAAWGSDAVAGVVNFTLDTDFVGAAGSLQGGTTDHGGGTERAASIALGGEYLGGRLHALLAVDWADVEAVPRAASRDWFRGTKVIANPAFVPGGGQPARIIRDGVGLSQSSNGGLITAGPLRGTAFGPGGIPSPFSFGTVSGLSSFGGTADDLGGEVQIQDAISRSSTYGRLSYRFDSGSEMFIDLIAARSEANPTSVPYLRQGNITVRRDNPFLTTTIVNQMTTLGLQTFSMGRTNQDLGRVTYDNISRLVDVRLGAKGAFGDGWRWDITAGVGTNRFGIDAKNNVIVPRFNLAIDAVRNPLSGQIVCRSSLSGASSDCVPLNLFGEGSPSREARQYVLGVSSQRIDYEQRILAANLRGTVASLPEGPVSLAAGTEYRYQSYEAVGDALSATNAFWLGNYKSSRGDYNVREAYLEVAAPVLGKTPLSEHLEINAAVRHTDYSRSGSVTTWKAGVVWDVNDWMRLRTTRSRDIRAPNLGDLFQANATAVANIVDPVLNAGYQTTRVTSGSLDLDPERADTRAFGLVLQPAALPGLSLSIDYFDIDIADAIITPDAQVLINRCAVGEAALCANITRAPIDNRISEVRVKPVNAQVERTSGFDVEIGYRRSLDLSDRIADESLLVRAVATHVRERVVDAVGARFDYAGSLADATAVPDRRAYVFVGLQSPRFDASATLRFIGSGVLRSEWSAADIEDNGVSSVTYVDLGATFRPRLAEPLELFASVGNVFDRAPPRAPVTTGTSFLNTGTNMLLYDTVGRKYSFGLRARF
jgi:outer membrane receptor protein involved in Fe transport